jgi:hypothetical protein
VHETDEPNALVDFVDSELLAKSPHGAGRKPVVGLAVLGARAVFASAKSTGRASKHAAAVPEPSTWAMMILGFFASASWLIVVGIRPPSQPDQIDIANTETAFWGGLFVCARRCRIGAAEAEERPMKTVWVYADSSKGVSGINCMKLPAFRRDAARRLNKALGRRMVERDQCIRHCVTLRAA